MVSIGTITSYSLKKGDTKIINGMLLHCAWHKALYIAALLPLYHSNVVLYAMHMVLSKASPLLANYYFSPTLKV